MTTSDGDLQYSWLLGRCNLLNEDLSGVKQNGVLDPCSPGTELLLINQFIA